MSSSSRVSDRGVGVRDEVVVVGVSLDNPVSDAMLPRSRRV